MPDGPRQLRDLSTMIRAMNPVTGVNPFTLVNCADLGDVGPNPIDLEDSMTRIAEFYAGLRRRGYCSITAETMTPGAAPLRPDSGITTSW